jgi:MFS family permease
MDLLPLRARKMTRVRVGYADLLRNRRFSLAVTSTALGGGGYSVYAIAILWLSFQLSGSLAIAGLVLLVEFGLYSITFIAGPMVDRARNLRSILAIGYALQAICAFVIGATLDLRVLTIPLLLILVGATSLVWDFTWTAENALIPRIVDQEDLFRANGMMGAVGGGNTIAGYAAGAGLILLTGPGGAMFLYAALQVAAMLVILPVSVPSQRIVTTRALADFWDGWRELGRGPSKPLLQLAIFGGFQGFFVEAPPLLVTLLSDLKFANPSLTYGVLFTSFAVGGVVGGLLLGRWNPRQRLTLVMSGGTAATGLLLIAATYSAPSLIASVVLWFLVGLAGVAFYSAFLVYLQARVPADRFGRVLTNVYFFRGVPSAIGAATIGLLATLWGPTTLAMFIGIAWIVIAVAGPTLLPALKGLTF